MTDHNPDHPHETESCTDPLCDRHRYDLYAALIGVADSWHDSLPSEPLTRSDDLETAFGAIARLAAREVFG